WSPTGRQCEDRSRTKHRRNRDVRSGKSVEGIDRWASRNSESMVTSRRQKSSPCWLSSKRTRSLPQNVESAEQSHSRLGLIVQNAEATRLTGSQSMATRSLSPSHSSILRLPSSSKTRLTCSE